MRRLHAGRTIGVEGRLEGHAGTHADTLDLAGGRDLAGHRVPGQVRHRTVHLGVDVAAVDRACDRIGVDRGRRGLLVGVVAIDQLVPEAFLGLVAGQALDVGAQLRQHLVVALVVLRQHFQHLDHGHHRPAVGARPAQLRMVAHAFDVAVHVDAQLRVEHALRELQHLVDGVVVVLAVARHLAQVGHGRHAHEHVVQPDRVRQRTHLAPALAVRSAARQDAVLQAVLVLGDEVAADADHLAVVDLRAAHLGLQEAVAQGAGIVQRVRVQEALDRRVRVGAVRLHHRQVGPGQLRQQRVALLGVVGVALVAGGLAGRQHAQVGDAPFVAGQAEVARFQHRIRLGLGEVGDRRIVALVDQLSRRGAVQVGEHAVEHGLDLVSFHRLVAGRVLDVEGVQHRIGRGRAFFLGRRRVLRNGAHGREQARNEQADQCTARHGGGHLGCLLFISAGESSGYRWCGATRSCEIPCSPG